MDALLQTFFSLEQRRRTEPLPPSTASQQDANPDNILDRDRNDVDAGIEEEEEEESEQHEKERIEALDEIIQLISRSQTKVQDLLIGMGAQLTSEDPRMRVRGLVLICEVLRRANENAVTRVTAEQLLVFLMARLESDAEASAVSCLKGIQTLLERHRDKIEARLQARAAHHVLNTLQVQDLAQPLRIIIYHISRDFLERVVDRDQGNDFPPALVADDYPKLFRLAMDGEKDPRCLMVCLRVVQLLLSAPRFRERFVEDAFDAVSVYFPVTFRPPPNDPHGITHESLVEALNSVFKASKGMADCVIPMALERARLTSTEAGQARIEALKALHACVPSYGIEGISPYLVDLRDALVGLILSPDDAELAKEALGCLMQIARMCAFYETTGVDSPWEVFVMVTLRRSAQALDLSVNSMASTAAGGILVAVAESCGVGMSEVLSLVVPIVRKWTSSSSSGGEEEGIKEAQQRTAALSLLRDILRSLNPDVDYAYADAANDPLGPKARELIKMLVDGGEALLETTSIARVEGERAEEDVRSLSLFVGCIEELIVRPRALAVSKEEADRAHAFVLRVAIASMDTVPGGGSPFSLDLTALSLKALRRIDTKYLDLKFPSPTLTVAAPAIVRAGGNTSASTGLPVAVGALACLSHLVTPRNDDYAIFVVDYVMGGAELDSLLAKACLTRVAENASLQACKRCFLPAVVDRLLEDSANSLALLATIASKLGPDETLARRGFERLKSLNGEADEKCAILFTASLGVEGLEASLMSEALTLIWDAVSRVAIAQTTGDTKQNARPSPVVSVLSTLLNKCDTSAASTFVDRLVGDIAGAGGRAAVPIDSLITRSALKGVFAGLAVRNHARSHDVGRVILSRILDSGDLFCATAFGEAIEAYASPAFPRRNVLFRQKVCEQYAGILAQASITPSPSQEQSQEVREAAIAAYASMIGAEAFPDRLLSQRLDEALPVISTGATLVLKAISGEGREEESSNQRLGALSSAILRAVSKIIKLDVNRTVSHLASLIPFLLTQCSVSRRGGGSPARRTAALDDLQTLAARLPYHHLHPYKTSVCRVLLGALDDPRKEVRLRAVTCREKWISFSQ